ncbi:MAG: serine hydrolase [Candidatus Baltobacteraceae bacterium]
MRIALALAFVIAQMQLPFPLAHLQATLAIAASRAPGVTGVAVRDLGSAYVSGYNMHQVMPAASTIKIPIMVEVFRQMEEGNFDLNRRVELLEGDRDWGSGAIAGSPVGSSYAVSALLTQMITVSDNTAANMLIRLVGRRHINQTMQRLGLDHTMLTDSIHTEGWSVRLTLRTTPSDMVGLLAKMAKKQLVDRWSSQQMIDILEHQEINTLLPEPLPAIPIAHKTGSFDDTLNDVGIVYADQPYVIAVLTTNLSSLPAGRQFIRRVSKMAYSNFQALARLRASGLLDAQPEPQTTAPADGGSQGDASMWATPQPSPSASP